MSPFGAAGCPGGARCGEAGFVSGTSCNGFLVMLALSGGGWLVVFRKELVLVVPSVGCVDNLVEVVSCFECLPLVVYVCARASEVVGGPICGIYHERGA